MKRLLLLLPILFLFPNFSHAALTDNLGAYWKLDEANGNPADSSGNSNTLTNVGTAVFSAGKINNGVTIVRNTKYFYAADSASISPTSALSLSLWVKFTNVPSGGTYQFLYSNWGGEGDGGDYSHYVYYIDDGGTLKLRFGYRDASGNNTTATKAYTFSTATWYHIAVTVDATNKLILFYINGTAQTSTYEAQVATTIKDNSMRKYVGMGFDGSAYGGTDGMLDEVGVWTRVLTGAEVTSLYNSGTGLQYPFTVASVAIPILDLVKSFFIW